MPRGQTECSSEIIRTAEWHGPDTTPPINLPSQNTLRHTTSMLFQPDTH